MVALRHLNVATSWTAVERIVICGEVIIDALYAVDGHGDRQKDAGHWIEIPESHILLDHECRCDDQHAEHRRDERVNSCSQREK